METNSRKLLRRLQREGWQNMHRLMIHENGEPYILFERYTRMADRARNARAAMAGRV